MLKAFIGLVVALPILLASNQSYALTKTGRITGLWLSSPGNLPFRISLDNAPSECAAGILYLDINHPNYQAYVSGLMLAFSLGKQVQVNYTPAQAVGGYSLPACAIQEYGVAS